MDGWSRRSITAQIPFTAFNNSVRDVVRAHRSFVAGMTILSPKVTECSYFPMVTMTYSFQTRCPKCCRKNIKSVEKRSFVTFNSATGVMRRRDASGDTSINAFAIWNFSVSGVERGNISPPPGYSAAISVPDASYNNFTSRSCIVFVPPVRITMSILAASSFLCVLGHILARYGCIYPVTLDGEMFGALAAVGCRYFCVSSHALVLR